MKSITCHTCGGSGQETLDGPLADTMALFRGKKALSAAEVQELLPDTTQPGMHMRLERLRSFGLLTRMRRPKTRVWLYTRAFQPRAARR